MEAKSFKDKRERYHKLKRRNSELEGQSSSLRERNLSVEKKILAIERELKRLRTVNVELSQKVEEELLKQQIFQDKLEFIGDEVARLESSYSARRLKYQGAVKETDRLEKELEKLNAKKNAYIKYSQRASGAQAALEHRREAVRNNLHEADLETKQLADRRGEGKLQTPKTHEVLQDRIRRLCGKDLKTGSVLYHSLRSIISNIEENDFEGVNYKTLVDKSKTKMGGRLHFQNVSSQYSDLCEHLGPVIAELGKRFRSHGIEIKTKAKRDPSGLVSEVDVTVVLNLPALKEATPSA